MTVADNTGDIVILPNDVLQLNSILGNEILLPQRKFIENPLPMLQTTIAVKKSEQREILLGALTEISDGDPLLKYYVDTTTHEIILSFLGNKEKLRRFLYMTGFSVILWNLQKQQGKI